MIEKNAVDRLPQSKRLLLLAKVRSVFEGFCHSLCDSLIVEAHSSTIHARTLCDLRHVIVLVTKNQSRVAYEPSQVYKIWVRLYKVCDRPAYPTAAEPF
jgi:hypothetical protein